MTDVAAGPEEVVADISAAKFLQEVPPGESRQLTVDTFDTAGYPTFRWPPVELCCSNVKCAGFRFADPITTSPVEFDRYTQKNMFGVIIAAEIAKVT
jgi:hypothetical protein